MSKIKPIVRRTGIFKETRIRIPADKIGKYRQLIVQSLRPNDLNDFERYIVSLLRAKDVTMQQGMTIDEFDRLAEEGYELRGAGGWYGILTGTLKDDPAIDDAFGALNAIHAIRGFIDTDAMRAVMEGVRLGMLLTRLGVRPFERLASIGQKVTSGGRKGAEIVRRNDIAERDRRIRELVYQRYDALPAARRPKKDDVVADVARHFKLSKYHVYRILRAQKKSTGATSRCQ